MQDIVFGQVSAISEKMKRIMLAFVWWVNAFYARCELAQYESCRYLEET